MGGAALAGVVLGYALAAGQIIHFWIIQKMVKTSSLSLWLHLPVGPWPWHHVDKLGVATRKPSSRARRQEGWFQPPLLLEQHPHVFACWRSDHKTCQIEKPNKEDKLVLVYFYRNVKEDV